MPRAPRTRRATIQRPPLVSWLASRPLVTLVAAGVVGLCVVILISLTANALRGGSISAPSSTEAIRPDSPARAESAAAASPTAEPTALAFAPAESAAPAPTSALTQPTVAPTPTSAPSPTSPASSPATSASAPPPTDERVIVQAAGAEGVNLRIEPSTTAARVKLLRDGTVLEVIGEDEEADGRRWRKVRDASDGATGWVAADLLVAEHPPTSVPEPTAPPVQVAAPPTRTAQATPTTGETPPPAAPSTRPAQATPTPGQPVLAATAAPQTGRPPQIAATPLPPATAQPPAPATAAPRPIATAAPAQKPAGGRAAPQGASCPASAPIKGNHSPRGEWIYHVPGGQFYNVTRPEDCFATEADARAAGYRPSQR